MDQDSEPDPDPTIFVIDLQNTNKKRIFLTKFSGYYFLKVHFYFYHFSKVQKKSQNSRNQGFSYFFCLVIEESGSGPIHLPNGSGSGRPREVDLEKGSVANPDPIPDLSDPYDFVPPSIIKHKW
jgi:hypothetical protein